MLGSIFCNVSTNSALNFWLVIPIWKIRSADLWQFWKLCHILYDASKFCLHKQERLLSEVKLQGLHKFDKTLKLKSYYEKVDRRFERNSHRPIQYDHFVCSLTRFVCTLYIYVELPVSRLRHEILVCLFCVVCMLSEWGISEFSWHSNVVSSIYFKFLHKICVKFICF